MKFSVMVTAAIALSVLVAPVAAHAYVLLPYYWKNGVDSLTYKWGSDLQLPDTVIRKAFETAVADWDGTPTKISLTYNSASPNTLTTYHLYDSNDYGYCLTNYSGGYMTSFTAMVNSGNPNITTANVARSAAVHELGHAIGLDHTTEIAVMNQNRNRTSIYTPLSDDIKGVNARYK